MVVLTTAISGSGEMKYLERFAKYAGARGKTVKIFNAADLYLEHAAKIGIRLNKERVLNTDPKNMRSIQSGAMERIISEIARLSAENYLVVVNVHASFYRKGSFDNGFNSYYLNELKPDAYINFVSDAALVSKNLSQRRQWSFLFNSEDSRDYKNILKKIMLWQSDEVKDTRGWAERDQKDFFVIPTSAPESVMHRLLFEKWRKVFYIGMPLSFFNDAKYAEARQRIDNLAAWLDELVVVIDPRHVEPLTPELLAKIDKEIYHNVVVRDLYWLIPQCHGMVAFWPEVVPSSGVDNEIREVYTTNGDSFLIYPYDTKPAGPFLVEWTDELVFQNEEAFKPVFLEYLGQDYLTKCGQHNAIAERRAK